jgi:signal transduction histidine kinase
MLRIRSTQSESTMSYLKQAGWRLFLGVGVVLAAAYYLAPPSAAKLVVWPIIGVASAAAIVLGTLWHRPTSPAAWYLMAAAQISFTAGDTLYNIRARVLHSGQVFPSIVDLCYLLTYPLLIAGLLLLIRRRSPGRDAASLIDAAMITIGIGLLSWIFLISPYVRADLPLLQLLVAVAYPLGDVLLLAVAVRLAIGAGRRTLAWWLVATAMVGVLAADSLFVFQQVNGTWQVGGPVDLGWIVFYVCWGAAALHPSMVALSTREQPPVRLTTPRLLFIGAAALLAPVVLTVQWLRGVTIDSGMIASVAAVLFVLAAARMWDLSSQVAIGRERARSIDRILHVRQGEQARVARDLEDGPIHWLKGAMGKLGQARTYASQTDPGRADGILQELEDGLTQQIHHLRAQLGILRSAALEQLGLLGAITSQAESFTATSGVLCTVEAKQEDIDENLPPYVQRVLYHVAREALSSIDRDGHPVERIMLSLNSEGHYLRLSITVFGEGLEESRLRTTALDSMREWVEMVAGGRLAVVPGPTTVILVELDRQQLIMRERESPAASSNGSHIG